MTMDNESKDEEYNDDFDATKNDDEEKKSARSSSRSSRSRSRSRSRSKSRSRSRSSSQERKSDGEKKSDDSDGGRSSKSENNMRKKDNDDSDGSHHSNKSEVRKEAPASVKSTATSSSAVNDKASKNRPSSTRSIRSSTSTRTPRGKSPKRANSPHIQARESDAAKIYGKSPRAGSRSRDPPITNKLPPRHKTQVKVSQQDLIEQLKKTNAALLKQFAQAQAQWKELQRQAKEIEKVSPSPTTPQPPTKLSPKEQKALDIEYNKLKAEYHELSNNVHQLKKKFDTSQESKLKKKLKAQEEIITKIKDEMKHFSQVQRDRTKQLQSGDDLPQQLFKLQNHCAKEISIQQALLDKTQESADKAAQAVGRQQKLLSQVMAGDNFTDITLADLRKAQQSLIKIGETDKILEGLKYKQNVLQRQITQMQRQGKSGVTPPRNDKDDDLFEEAEELKHELAQLKQKLQTVEGKLEKLDHKGNDEDNDGPLSASKPAWDEEVSLDSLQEEQERKVKEKERKKKLEVKRAHELENEIEMAQKAAKEDELRKKKEELRKKEDQERKEREELSRLREERSMKHSSKIKPKESDDEEEDDKKDTKKPIWLAEVNTSQTPEEEDEKIDKKPNINDKSNLWLKGDEDGDNKSEHFEEEELADDNEAETVSKTTTPEPALPTRISTGASVKLEEDLIVTNASTPEPRPESSKGSRSNSPQPPAVTLASTPVVSSTVDQQEIKPVVEKKSASPFNFMKLNTSKPSPSPITTSTVNTTSPSLAATTVPEVDPSPLLPPISTSQTIAPIESKPTVTPSPPASTVPSSAPTPEPTPPPVVAPAPAPPPKPAGNPFSFLSNNPAPKKANAFQFLKPQAVADTPAPVSTVAVQPEATKPDPFAGIFSSNPTPPPAQLTAPLASNSTPYTNTTTTVNPPTSSFSSSIKVNETTTQNPPNSTLNTQSSPVVNTPAPTPPIVTPSPPIVDTTPAPTVAAPPKPSANPFGFMKSTTTAAPSPSPFSFLAKPAAQTPAPAPTPAPTAPEPQPTIQQPTNTLNSSNNTQPNPAPALTSGANPFSFMAPKPAAPKPAGPSWLDEPQNNTNKAAGGYMPSFGAVPRRGRGWENGNSNAATSGPAVAAGVPKQTPSWLD